MSDVNIAVLEGVVHRPPQWRLLPSGVSVTSFDVKVKYDEGGSDVVRVSWMDAPASAMELAEGDVVAVRGRVRSYWSGRRSETDILAVRVERRRAAAKVRRLFTESMVTLQEASP